MGDLKCTLRNDCHNTPEIRNLTKKTIISDSNFHISVYSSAVSMTSTAENFQNSANNNNYNNNYDNVYGAVIMTKVIA